jgi:hypothetical protein
MGFEVNGGHDGIAPMVACLDMLENGGRRKGGPYSGFVARVDGCSINVKLSKIERDSGYPWTIFGMG